MRHRHAHSRACACAHIVWNSSKGANEERRQRAKSKNNTVGRSWWMPQGVYGTRTRQAPLCHTADPLRARNDVLGQTHGGTIVSVWSIWKPECSGLTWLTIFHVRCTASSALHEKLGACAHRQHSGLPQHIWYSVRVALTGDEEANVEPHNDTVTLELQR